MELSKFCADNLNDLGVMKDFLISLIAYYTPEWCLDVPRLDVSDVLIMLIADVGTIGSDDSAQTLKDNGVFLMAAEEYSI
jgi:hypothetical protein